MSEENWDGNIIQYVVQLALEYDSQTPENEKNFHDTVKFVKKRLVEKGIIKSKKYVATCLIKPKALMQKKSSEVKKEDKSEQSNASTKSEGQKVLQNEQIDDCQKTQVQSFSEQSKHGNELKSKQCPNKRSHAVGGTSLQVNYPMAAADDAFKEQKKPMRENEIPENKRRCSRSTPLKHTNSGMFDATNNSIQGDKGPKIISADCEKQEGEFLNKKVKLKRTYPTESSTKKPKLCISDESNLPDFPGAIKGCINIGGHPQPVSSQENPMEADAINDKNNDIEKEHTVNDCSKNTITVTPTPEKQSNVQKISERSKRNTRSASNSNSSKIEIEKNSVEDCKMDKANTVKPKHVADSDKKKQKFSYDNKSHKGFSGCIKIEEYPQLLSSQQNPEEIDTIKDKNVNDCSKAAVKVASTPEKQSSVRKISERSKRNTRSSSNSSKIEIDENSVEDYKVDEAKTVKPKHMPDSDTKKKKYSNDNTSHKGFPGDNCVNIGQPSQPTSSQQTKTDKAHSKNGDSDSLDVSNEDTPVSTSNTVATPKTDIELNVKKIAERSKRSSRTTSCSSRSNLDAEKSIAEGSCVNFGQNSQPISEQQTKTEKTQNVSKGQILVRTSPKTDKELNDRNIAEGSTRNLRSSSSSYSTKHDVGKATHKGFGNEVKAMVTIHHPYKLCGALKNETIMAIPPKEHSFGDLDEIQIDKEASTTKKPRRNTRLLKSAPKCKNTTVSDCGILDDESNGNNSSKLTTKAEVLMPMEGNDSQQSNTITLPTSILPNDGKTTSTNTTETYHSNNKLTKTIPATTYNQADMKKINLNHSPGKSKTNSVLVETCEIKLEGNNNESVDFIETQHLTQKRAESQRSQSDDSSFVQTDGNDAIVQPTLQATIQRISKNPNSVERPTNFKIKKEQTSKRRPIGEKRAAYLKERKRKNQSKKTEPIQNSLSSDQRYKKEESISADECLETPRDPELPPDNPPDFYSSVKEDHDILQQLESPALKRIKLEAPPTQPPTPQALPACTVQDILPIYDSAGPSGIQEQPVSSPSPPVIQDAELGSPRRSSTETDPNISYTLTNDAGSETISASQPENDPPGDYQAFMSSLGPMCPTSPPLSPSMVYPDTPRSSKQAMSPSGEERNLPVNEVLSATSVEKISAIVTEKVDSVMRKVEERMVQRFEDFQKIILETLKSRTPPKSQ